MLWIGDRKRKVGKVLQACSYLYSFLSLLSHSAVVARELGLPTIVGVSGGLMKRLKTGMRVHIDAGKVIKN